MERVSNAEVVGNYARLWPLTHAFMTGVPFLGAQALVEPQFAMLGFMPWSHGKQVVTAAMFCTAMTAFA